MTGKHRGQRVTVRLLLAASSFLEYANICQPIFKSHALLPSTRAAAMLNAAATLNDLRPRRASIHKKQAKLKNQAPGPEEGKGIHRMVWATAVNQAFFSIPLGKSGGILMSWPAWIVGWWGWSR